MLMIPDMRADRKRCAIALLVFGLCWPARAQLVAPGSPTAGSAGKLIVIGFMGGNVSAGNLVHREALVAKELQKSYPDALHAAVFANHDWKKALGTVLQLLGADGDGRLSTAEKSAARIVI